MKNIEIEFQTAWRGKEEKKNFKIVEREEREMKGEEEKIIQK